MSDQGYYIYDLRLEESIILSSYEIAPDVFLLSMPRAHDFIPGQVIGLALDPKDDARLYSICSGKDQDELQVLFNVKQDGYLTPSLANVHQGDKIWISKPYGSFLGTTEAAYWIAAGTGIAPFLSMFRSGQGRDKVLIHGSRTLDSFYFSEEFKPILQGNYIRCCSREARNEVYEGRVTDYLKYCTHLPPDHKYYICGLAEMVVEARDILISRGIPFEQIMAEIYF